jgi:Ca-activated chloride channel homolog
MNFIFLSARTTARIRTGLVIATLAASVGLITANAQSPSRPPGSPSEATTPGQAPGQAATPPNPQQPDSQTTRQSPSFKAGVDLVSLNVTVADNASASRYVTDLQQQDFQVYEDGVLQEVTFFNKTNLPIALGLLLDTSASMETKLPVAQEAAVGFAKKLRSQDLAEVIDFDSRVTILQTFTNKAPDLETAIRKTSAGGSTSMYNAIYIALKDLKKVVATNVDEIRRQAIVVLSDGEDTSSLLPFEEVLDLAKRSETAIYAIGLRSNELGASSNKGFKEAEFVLRQLSQETGGRVFFPTSASELPGIYTQISDELSSQYTVGYTSRNGKRDGAWRRVVVRVDRANATPRTKQGYFAPSR